MSTSLNNVVFEVYSELTARAEARKVTKLQKLFMTPMKVFPWLKWHIKAMMCEYGRKNYSVLTSKGKPNVFTPTDKVFPDTKIAVYTVITGGYDNLRSPIYVDDTLDYYVVTDAEIASVNTQKGGGQCFKRLPIPAHIEGLSNVKKGRTGTLSCILMKPSQKA